MTKESSTATVMGRRHWLVLLIFLAITIGYSDRVNMSVAAVAMKEYYGWSQTTKGLVLSAFFIGYMAFMFPSGWLTTRWGGRRVLGLAVFWWSLLTLLTPLAASISIPVLIAARIALGLGEAAMFPAAFAMLAYWATESERTRATALVMSGISLGTVLGLMVTGWIVARFDWPVAFHVFGVIGLAWTAVWFAFAGEHPATDRRLSETERELLEGAVPAMVSRPTVPWRQLVLHPSVWSLVITHFACTWTLYMLLSWLPSYFRDAQGVSIAGSGLLSAAPWIAMFLLTFVAVRLSDAMVRHGTRLAIARKLMQGIGLIGSAALLLLAPQVDSVGAATVIICAATGLLGFCWSGYTPNFLDLAPRHSALLMGFSNTWATVPGIVGVAVTGWLVDLTGSYVAAFLLAGAVSLFGTLAFCLFGSTRPIVE